VATLGRIEMALGNETRGKQLLEEARKELPANAAVAGALGELAAKQGETAVAMDFLLTARLGAALPHLLSPPWNRCIVRPTAARWTDWRIC